MCIGVYVRRLSIPISISISIYVVRISIPVEGHVRVNFSEMGMCVDCVLYMFVQE